jgi:hypothetical protein
MAFPRAPDFHAGDAGRERISACGIGLGGTRVQASGAGDTGAAFKRLAADRADVRAFCALTNDALSGRIAADHKSAVILSGDFVGH